MKKYTLTITILVILLSLAKAYAVCTLVKPRALNYGNYDGTYTAPALNGTTTLTIICTDNNPHKFCAHLVNSSNSTGLLKDQIYREPARTTEMTTNDCFTPNNNGQPYTASCNHSCTLPVYGQLAKAQVVTPKTYAANYSIQLDVDDQASNQVVLTTESTVLAHASITANNFNFGNYDPHSSQDLKEGQKNLQIIGTIGTKYTISLSAGNSGDQVQRTMKSGNNILAYNFYLPASASSCGYNTIWSTTGGWNDTGSGYSQQILVCGVIPKKQYVTAGTYSDTIIATVTY
jgi:spore coat protein U-like protein